MVVLPVVELYWCLPRNANFYDSSVRSTC